MATPNKGFFMETRTAAGGSSMAAMALNPSPISSQRLLSLKGARLAELRYAGGRTASPPPLSPSLCTKASPPAR